MSASTMALEPMPVVCDVSRRDALMLKEIADQRSGQRVFLRAPIKIRLQSESTEHIGLLRDLSESGMFFYSNIKPQVGSKLEFEFLLTKHGTQPRWMFCSGQAVRVEHPIEGAAVGVAVRVQLQGKAIDADAPPYHGGFACHLQAMQAS